MTVYAKEGLHVVFSLTLRWQGKRNEPSQKLSQEHITGLLAERGLWLGTVTLHMTAICHFLFAQSCVVIRSSQTKNKSDTKSYATMF